MRKWKLGLCFIMLAYSVPVVIAAPAAKEKVAAPEERKETLVGTFALNSPAGREIAEAIKNGTVTPQQLFEAGDKSEIAADVEAATIFYKAAADGGHAEAQARIAFILYRSGFDEQAFDFFRKSAEQGNAEGMYGLGVAYEGGTGTKQDFVEARKWYTRAAEKGNLPSLHAMVDAYRLGNLGLNDAALKSPEALSWIRRGADADFVPAVQSLADSYRLGRYGLAIDLKLAEELDAKLKKLLGIKEVEKRKKRR